MSDRHYVPVANVEDVPAGKVKLVEVAGKPILLCHTKDRIFAVINKCSHADEKLECGRMKAGWIACPVHGARFNLETGAPMNPPATQPIETFAVRIVGDRIEVEV
ncbi:Rieske 2Fe-2S domain-containing protein [Sphingobium sufflavum]|uniref:Rieske (2Fe-2S) protein n=1 Tax=Sphingobium sufflavum TaxID=1129547 RepID=UPI001F47978B|nr:Rieske 2Fe-2S domain-containing protein [Sphingobium sufflavum]MCE7797534.1 Rieske 2Fe-2S domain-containing protein [Sphingobium sufflavum]